jgi:hypothetical protein
MRGEEKKKQCHGLTRKNTEKTEAETRNEEKTENQVEALPRKDTEKHGNRNKQKQKISDDYTLTTLLGHAAFLHQSFA